MAPKRKNKAIIKSESSLSDEYIPKEEEKITIKTEDMINELLQIPRYVHTNPFQFKGRLGYA